MGRHRAFPGGEFPVSKTVRLARASSCLGSQNCHGLADQFIHCSINLSVNDIKPSLLLPIGVIMALTDSNDLTACLVSIRPAAIASGLAPCPRRRWTACPCCMTKAPAMPASARFPGRCLVRNAAAALTLLGMAALALDAGTTLKSCFAWAFLVLIGVAALLRSYIRLHPPRCYSTAPTPSPKRRRICAPYFFMPASAFSLGCRVPFLGPAARGRSRRRPWPSRACRSLASTLLPGKIRAVRSPLSFP